MKRRDIFRVAPANPNNKNRKSQDKNIIDIKLGDWKPYITKIATIRKIIDTIDKRFTKIEQLAEKIISSDEAPSCPVCKHNKAVIKNGHDKNGVQKLICKNQHEEDNVISIRISQEIDFEIIMPRKVKSSSGRLYFRATTSYEALQLYANEMVMAISMVMNGTTIDFTVEFLGLSKAMIEKILDALADIKPMINIPDDVDESDIIAIYLDFSSSGISRQYGLATLVVNNTPTLILSLRESKSEVLMILSALRKKLEERVRLKDKVIVIITDGSNSYPEPIRKVFPEAIHVVQIHDKRKLGVVLVNFTVPSEVSYTIRMRWDVFREDESKRRILDLETKDTVELYLGTMNCSDPHKFLDAVETNRNFKAPEVGSKINDATLLFRGNLRDLVSKFRFVERVILALAVLFAGSFITTNHAEVRFSSKTVIARHKSTRGRGRILRCLVNYYNLHHSSNIARLRVADGGRPPDSPYLLAL